MWSSIAFGAFLLAFAGFMIMRHRAAWRLAQEEDLDEPDLDFLRRQFRRRMQASGMIGLVGVAVIVGIWVTHTVTAAIYWSVVILIVLWIGMLAVSDLINTRYYYGQLAQKHVEEHARLTAELHRIKSRDSNGKPQAQGEQPTDDGV